MKQSFILAVCLTVLLIITPAYGQDDQQQTRTAYTKPPVEQLKKSLTPLQFSVTQHEDTEPPYKNKYWDEKRDGIYVDIVSGEPLFSSESKYKSGTGWPSFYEPLVAENK